MRANEIITENQEPINLAPNDTSPAKAWIEKVYAKYPQEWQNNHVMPLGDDQFAMFELSPSFGKRGAVEVKWFQAYPLRQGVGSRAMQELQAMAREDGIHLTLFPWDKGQVSQSKLTKFYKGHGFKPVHKGSKSMQWEPTTEAEGEPEGVPHLTKTVLQHIIQQVGTEGAHAIVKSLEWGDGAAKELLALIVRDLKQDVGMSESTKQRLDAHCWKGKHKEGTKIKGGVRVNNCVANEDWSKVNKHDKTNGLSQKAVNAYRHEHPGSKLQTAVTKKPSELKAGSKDAKRRKSFCARMSGNKGPMKKPNGEATPKALALRRWNCESIEEMSNLIQKGEQYIADLKENFKDGRHPEDKGDSARHGIPKHATIGSLRKIAKQGGRKGQLAHWQANMRSGRAK
jgi:hypothetical protein